MLYTRKGIKNSKGNNNKIMSVTINPSELLEEDKPQTTWQEVFLLVHESSYRSDEEIPANVTGHNKPLSVSKKQVSLSSKSLKKKKGAKVQEHNMIFTVCTVYLIVGFFSVLSEKYDYNFFVLYINVDLKQ